MRFFTHKLIIGWRIKHTNKQYFNLFGIMSLPWQRMVFGTFILKRIISHNLLSHSCGCTDCIAHINLLNRLQAARRVMDHCLEIWKFPTIK